MTNYAKEHFKEIDKIRNSIIYALNLPVDYQLVLFKDYLYINNDFKLQI